MTETLRNLAKLLREKEAQAQAAKNEKCANVIQAAIGLDYLRSKLGL